MFVFGYYFYIQDNILTAFVATALGATETEEVFILHDIIYFTASR